MPGAVDAQLEAAGRLAGEGRPFDALQLLLKAMKAQPREPRLRQAVATGLQGLPLDEAGDAVRGVLLDLCLDPDIAAQCLVDAILGLARNAAYFAPLLACAQDGGDLIAEQPGAARALAEDRLLVAMLGRAVINDPDMERILTALRRALLARGAPVAALPYAFACALAHQCFNVEYAFAQSGDERAPAEEISAEAVPADWEHRLALCAMLAPLHRLRGWERMLDWRPGDLSGDFRPLWQAQVADYRRERDIAAGLQTLTPVRDATSRAVQGMYEENPYPRWLAVHRPAPQPDDGVRRILVAGCGTGQHPIQVALAHPRCEVLALDLSRTSLAYAVRMAERYEVRNLQFRHADLLELGGWDERFDRIESLGVLHHLRDPMAGWRTLLGLLAERGSMRIGLYSRYAREPLAATRDLIAQQGHSATPEGIRAARRAILDLPEGHPARSVAWSDDFYSVSGCRDLLLHVQERSYTLPEIGECLRALGLRLVALQAPREVLAGFRAAFPAAAPTDLALWDLFERQYPEIFRGMYHFACMRAV